MLTTRHLDIGYGRRTVLTDLNLRLEPGALTVLIGANGCGKSTLLRTLGGSQPALRGDVLLDGSPLAALDAAERARRMAIVLTDRTGGGGLRVDELVAVGRHRFSGFFGRLHPDDRRAVAEALELVGLSHKAGAMVASLSDGERQKAMIARAVAQDAPLILMDEPTAFLDVSARFEVMELLGRLCRQRDRTVLLSTHDIAPSLAVADCVWAVADGTVSAGTPAALASAGVLDRVYAGVRFDASSGDYRR
ncbi:MAG: ABC transporter ATP-binding protein [Bacteroides sp.]|nr:ABC transporter ATP-binding protein [Bacteroides sp.]MCM1096411.1 ABC transporter ATP-binding protein [Terasakiella sp.]